MGAIKVKHFEGGRRLQSGGSAGSPDLASLLRDVADDLATLKTAVDAVVPPGDITAATPSSLTSPLATDVTDGALGAFTDPPSAAEMAALRSLVNQLRTTVIELDTLTTDMAARIGELITLITEIKTDVTAAVDAGTVGTLLTSKA